MPAVDFSKRHKNAIIKCLHCGDCIQSHYRHDFKWCKCNSVFVDGGSDYTRTGHKQNALYIYVQEERDFDATLVGPRNTKDDQEWCHRCEQLLLASTMREVMVDIQTFNGVSTALRHECKTGCTPKSSATQEGK